MENRDMCRWGCAFAITQAIAVGLSMVPSAASAQTVLPEVDVVAPTPLSGTRSTKPTINNTATPGAQSAAPAAGSTGPTDLTSIDRDKVPSNTSVLTSTDFNHEYTTDFLDAVNRSVPGVYLSDQTGNPFQKDLDYRGFTASPVQGTPEGIAVYQNGTRVNESFGDVVNWDFIPEKAIDKFTLFPSNPVFGLNAIGGAVSIQMKNGFTWQGTEVETLAGSYGRTQGSVEFGKQDGNLAYYALLETAYDQGWRDYASNSHVNRMYADFGGRNDETEFHLSFTGADDILGNVAATPLNMLSKNYGSVYTWPQFTALQLAFIQANLTHNFSDTLSFQGNLYYRGFWQSHVDGNGTNAFPCTLDTMVTPAVLDTTGSNDLCVTAVNTGITLPVYGPPGNQVTNPAANIPGAFLGEDDDNQVATNTFGGTAQLTNTNTVFGHENHVVVGASLDRGSTQFTAQSQLGTINPGDLFVQAFGVQINQPSADFSNVDLHSTNLYTGIFATDTFDVTNRLSITAGARFNIAQINVQDESGESPQLTGDNYYQHFNPMIGATYKITPNVTAYADYAIANRTPTPLELGCSSPVNPCMIDTFLVSDPPLKQVVSHTIEAGFRGSFGQDKKTGQVTWGVGVYDTISDNDIINVAAQLGEVSNFGFFQNFGETERKGVEVKVDYTNERWKLYANYTYVDATYESAGVLNSPSNPNAITDPSTGIQYINVVPGDHIGAIPANRFKAGAEYAVTEKWKVGADLNVVGNEYLFGDGTNQSPQVPAYAVLNLHTSYQVTKNVEVFGLINNALDQHYYLWGGFTDPTGFTPANGLNPSATLGVFPDSRAYVPGAPFEAYAGMKVRF
jgi:iron complex outermembrane recepter protein